MHANVSGGKPPYSFNWVDNTTAPLNSISIANPSFTSPSSANTLAYTVSVTDSLGNVAKDTIHITTMVQPLKIDAGANIIALEGGNVDLFALNTNGSVNAWSWTQIAGTNVTLTNANSNAPSFIAPNVAFPSIEELILRFLVPL